MMSMYEFTLFLAAITLGVGLYGFLTRRNLLVMLMCVELALSSINMMMVVFSKLHQSSNGEVIALLSMTLAAAESAVGLGLIIGLFRTLRTTSSESIEGLRD